ncbi:MAG: peptidase domain-containing ABC transporter [Synechococcales bacterium]|nr:peptidase domain-containing ABC transporter [Synechococcales bacterium]
MTQALSQIPLLLAEQDPWRSLSSSARSHLAQQSQLLRYRMGQVLLTREEMPQQVLVLCQGRARLLGYDPTQTVPMTLQRLEVGAILGAWSLVRGIACETAIASTEMIVLAIPAAIFLQLLNTEPPIAQFFQRQTSLVELFDLLNLELNRQPHRQLILTAAGFSSVKDLAQNLWQTHRVDYWFNKQTPLCSDTVWLLSNRLEDSEDHTSNLQVGDRFNPKSLPRRALKQPLRLVGVPLSILEPNPLDDPESPEADHPIPPISVVEESPQAAIPYADEQPPQETTPLAPPFRSKSLKQYPYVRGRGAVEAVFACFQMLSKHLDFPLRRDVVRKILQNYQRRSPQGSTLGSQLSLQHCGAIAEALGLQAQLVQVPAAVLGRLEAPAIVQWYDSFALLYEITSSSTVVAIPETGVTRQRTRDAIAVLEQIVEPGEPISVLLLKPTRNTPQEQFGLSWFLPSLAKYRHVLIEVFLASFFVQLFGLANPLITQTIIDEVLVKNSPDTLHVLGVFLVVIALFEALLSSVRTFLFTDTTNRIDLTLGSEIIDHLLRLPLRYFERRPVGELATRINELENIRQFLTGTALTVVLDAVFSVIYIVVMVFYSWLLSLVALATLPLFAALTALVSPIVRRQLRAKAERNAEAQSHLVEVLSGIQTVKAQNIELRSRWKWQEHYARYVSAGFKTVQTYTAAGSASNFLNQLSSLLVLWVGAFLVLDKQLTLGQLIAFRIIAGYVTSPLLRLTQLWQNFQETALSLERLADILDTPMESDEIDRDNIPMPPIQGHVKYQNVSFRFNPQGALQLDNVSLEFFSGQFVGIVGQSGSGKSTLMKLLPRLYPLESGRILIDGYDINKVELYSLRRQIGIVPQDPLLFEGSIQENIALNNPNATPEDIIEAAKIAVAHEFIMDLPNGYNTRVGERGASLSGGQRQRIAIARTILQNPQMLILDEATSALDYDSERQVCLNLAEAFQGRTVFFITHRLATLRNANHILMMDQGHVVEQGTHEELIELKGRYYCLYQQQEL